MGVVITKSANKIKKYDARVDGTKTVSFGQKVASDFTTHKDLQQKNDT